MLSRMAAACGQTALPPPRHRPRQRAHLRWETPPGASAQPLTRMLSRMAAACGQTALPPPRHRPRQRAHLRWETPPGASAQPLSRMLSRMAAACGQTAAATAPSTPTPARAPSVRNAAGGFRPTAQPHASAAWRQPAGKRPCHRPVNALASARTFGAKHSRGLPPNRSGACFSRMAAACGQTALPPLRQRPRQRAHLRCETPPVASAQPLSRMLSRMAAACGQTAAATAPSTPTPARAPSVRNTAGGFRPTAQPQRFEVHGTATAEI